MGYSVDLVLFRYWVASSIPCIDCIGTNIKSNSNAKSGAGMIDMTIFLILNRKPWQYIQDPQGIFGNMIHVE